MKQNKSVRRNVTSVMKTKHKKCEKCEKIQN